MRRYEYATPMRDREITGSHGGAVMSQQQKISIEEKLDLVRRCLNGELGVREAARIASVSPASIRRWISRYEMEGEKTFVPSIRNRVYSLELKLNAIQSYLSGDGSLLEISQRYEIRNPSLLANWIQTYNNFGCLNSVKFSGGGSYLRSGRPTTKDERIQIVNECLASEKNYGLLAMKYNVSYQQVRTWTLRYEERGEDGLEDRRGRPKKIQTDTSELEKEKADII